jgi:hypothetical protein
MQSNDENEYDVHDFVKNTEGGMFSYTTPYINTSVKNAGIRSRLRRQKEPLERVFFELWREPRHNSKK